MSLQFVDVGRIRERAEHDLKLERSIEAKKISKQASREAEGGALSGFFKNKGGAVAQRPEEAYVYTEYCEGLTSLLGKVVDHTCTGAGKIEDEMSQSQDVRQASVEILGGGTTNPYVGLAGAIFATCSRHKAIERMKPAPKDAKGKAKAG